MSHSHDGARRERRRYCGGCGRWFTSRPRFVGRTVHSSPFPARSESLKALTDLTRLFRPLSSHDDATNRIARMHSDARGAAAAGSNAHLPGARSHAATKGRRRFCLLRVLSKEQFLLLVLWRVKMRGVVPWTTKV